MPQADALDIESEGESEDEAEGDPGVLQLACACCRNVLSHRGMSVFLVADPASSLYSTDIPTDELRESQERKLIATCDCFALAVECSRCGTQVGYHVVRPCAICAQSDHNGMYWLLEHLAVVATDRGLRWSELPYNGATTLPDEEDKDNAITDIDNDICCICATRPMWRRTRVEGCRHEFCFGCISRELDARGACPLDRRPITRSMLVCVARDGDGEAHAHPT